MTLHWVIIGIIATCWLANLLIVFINKDKNTAIEAEQKRRFQVRVDRIRKFADQGDPVAQYKMGDVCNLHDGNFEEAYNWYKKAAEQGLIEAQVKLGSLFNSMLCQYNITDETELTNKYKVEAIYWSRKAAEQGDAGAQSMLASLYADRRGGIAPDYIQAYAWQSVAVGGWRPPSDWTQWHKNWTGSYWKSVNENRQRQQRSLRNYYYSLPKEKRPDAKKLARQYSKTYDKEARELYIHKRAQEGDARAMHMLGGRSHDLNDVAKEKKALYWYREAAAKGHVNSIETLGLMYREGRGCEQNHIKSWVCLKLAEMRGGCTSDLSRKTLNDLTDNMSSGQLDKAMKLLDAYEKKDIDSIYALPPDDYNHDSPLVKYYPE